VDCIQQYLKATPEKGLLLKRDGNLIMEAYTDIDDVNSVSDGKSISSYCSFLC
jgi:hypothetical protein